MIAFLLSRVRSTGQDRTSWLVLLFLLLGVLLPCAGILWFTNRTADQEAAAASREITEAYAGQLRFLRDRIDAAWQSRAAALGNPDSFQIAVSNQRADSVLVLRPDGSLAYPVPLGPLGPEIETPEWTLARSLEQRKNWPAAIANYQRLSQTAPNQDLAARAVQSQIRCLLLSGDKERALELIGSYFTRAPGLTANDPQGRRIAADEFLLAVQLLPKADPKRRTYLDRLISLLNSYADNRMPSSQRLFLMEEARMAGAAEFPTYEAERLAASFLDSDQPRAVGSGLQATNVSGVWKLPSPNGRLLGLFRSATVEAVTRSVLEGRAPSGVQFAAIPPGSPAGDAGIAAGPMLPGWGLSFTLTDTDRIDAEGQRRRSSYLWTGYLLATTIAVTGVLLGGSFRKHLQFARLKTDMVAAVSHELKTPLASMRLLVDALLEDKTVDPVKTREYLELMSGENARLTSLIENFLAFSRIEQRRLQFEFRATQPEQIVETAVASVRDRFLQGGCEVQVQVEPGLPRLQVDTDAMVTVLINLLDNAYKYTPGEKHLKVRAFRQSNRVVFAVADNGIGIPAREQKRIFRKFYQVDQSLARETGGVGLGLSIVQHIVEAHRGTITVDSKPGQGSTFSITIPEASAA